MTGAGALGMTGQALGMIEVGIKNWVALRFGGGVSWLDGKTECKGVVAEV